MDLCAVIAGLLGCAGSLFFIILYTILPDIRNVARRLLLSLSIVECLQAVLFTVQGVVGTDDEFWCWVTGPLLTASVMSSAIWTTCVAIYVALVVKKHGHLQSAQFFTRFRIVSWGYPLLWVTTIIVDHFVRYGRLSYSSIDTGKCFQSLSFDPLDKPFHWLGYTLPLAACLWITTIQYLQARLRIRELQAVEDADSPQQAQYSELAIKYTVIPAVFILFRSWVYVEGLVAIYYPEWWPVCSCLRVLGTALQGLVDTLIFVLLTYKLRAHVFSSLEDDDSFALLTEPSRDLLSEMSNVSNDSICSYTAASTRQTESQGD